MKLPLAFVLLALAASSSSALRRNGAAADGKVVELNEDNWRAVLKGEWMILFYAPWCPACRALHPTWVDFSDWTEDLNLDGIAAVDVTENPGLSGRFLVTALPTIYHVKDGEFHQYRGARDKDSFINVVEERQWRELDPIPGWKYPDSIQMSMVSMFFKTSMLLRNVHQMITEDYELPAYVSYLLFGALTILLGGLLGLLLVCCVDFVSPFLGGAGSGDEEENERRRRAAAAAAVTTSPSKPSNETGDDEADESQLEDDDDDYDGSQAEDGGDDDGSQAEEEEERPEAKAALRKRRPKKTD